MEIELEIDGEKVPLNNFVQKVLQNILDGVVKELKGVEDDWEKIKINLRK